ncbi:MAG: hypothetical protein GY863_06595 [bacterium]|nr:hypothetical protein [bacterium]
MRKAKKYKISRQTEQILKLSGCILAVLIFMFYIGPFIEKLPIVDPLIKVIVERNIDAGAMYYTDIEEFSTAEINIRNSLDYSPDNHK